MTESAAIQAFSFQNAGEELKKKLRLAFSELIPDDQWEELLRTEFEKFTEPRRVNDGYNRTKEAPSLLSEVSQEILRELANEALRKAFTEADFPVKLEALLQKHVEENKEAIMAEFVSNLFHGSIAMAMTQAAKDGYDAVMSHVTFDPTTGQHTFDPTQRNITGY